MSDDRQNDASHLERQRMQGLVNQIENRRPTPLVHAMSRLLITLSYAIISALIFSLVVQAFTLGGEAVLRSLAAAALPPLVIAYLAIFKRSFRPPTNISRTGLYIASTGWMIAMLMLTNYLTTTVDYGISLGILALSITLSGLIFLNKYIPFASALSCSFGIVTGLLLYALVFGFPS